MEPSVRLFKCSASVLLLSLAALPVRAAPLATAEVSVANAVDVLVADGVVEAVRQSDIAAQVPGRITALRVKAGDMVKAGQMLASIDERIADQQTRAGRSQVVALAAQLDAASKEYQRKQRLFQQGFLSQAALERAESDFKTTQAQTKAQMAQVESSIVQTELHTLVAPYAGIVSKVGVELGDMASPGKPLITIYDPKALRVTINVPQSRIAALRQDAVRFELPVLAAQPPIVSSDMTILPTADATSQVVQVRYALPAGLAGLTPGMFARAHVPLTGQNQERRLFVPARAVFRRGELTAVYVLGQTGKPQLRLVRGGRSQDGRTEILAGLEAGEKVVLDPLAVGAQR